MRELSLKELLENVEADLEESKRRICELKEEVGDPIGTSEYVTDDDNLISDIENDLERLYERTNVTDNYADLLRGVDIGGLGTPIASLASLISYKLYVKSRIADSRKYMCCFLSINAVFLVLMIFAVMIWK